MRILPSFFIIVMMLRFYYPRAARSSLCPLRVCQQKMFTSKTKTRRRGSLPGALYSNLN